MAQYKLTYFDGKGAAEPIRLLFKYGGIQFEDIRIKREDWPALKSTTPFGQLPLLEINGKTYNQSIAILRYIAQQIKLAGKNDLEDLEINAISDTISDLRPKFVGYYLEKDEAKKEELKKVLVNETLPFYLERFEAIVKKNNGYLAVGRLTWVDFYFTGSIYDRLVALMGDDLDKKYPNLGGVVKTINSIPSVKAWIDERPVTEF